MVWVQYQNYSLTGTPRGSARPQYKDVVLFVSAQNPENMVLARQPIDESGKWEVFELEGFGGWLCCEMDMIYRMQLGVQA